MAALFQTVFDFVLRLDRRDPLSISLTISAAEADVLRLIWSSFSGIEIGRMVLISNASIPYYFRKCAAKSFS